jgi:hypothetical protein
MPETPTASDLEKARLILREFGLLIGPASEMSDAIARAVAAGIALGRKDDCHVSARMLARWCSYGDKWLTSQSYSRACARAGLDRHIAE